MVRWEIHTLFFLSKIIKGLSPVWRPWRIWEDNIKIAFGKMCEVVGWVHLGQDSILWRDFMNAVMNPSSFITDDSF
jgi:hypothetical protein